MNFSLNKSNGAAAQRIQPWTISSVKFEGVELKSGTTKDGREWKAIQFKFRDNNNGTFEHMVFCPGDQGDVRPSGESNGRQWEMPSAMEQLQHTLAHVLSVLNPEGFEKLKGVELDLPKDFDKLYKAVAQILAKANGKETNLKLIANNKGYASVPNFININKTTHESYISNNWLGDNLSFSAYELSRKDKAAKSAPTKVEPTSTDSADDGLDDLDLGI